jgi:ABC-type amino acid transport substrate-binding protein
MYDARAAHDPVPRGRAARAAADAVLRVVLDTATATVRDFPLNICGYGAPMPADQAASVEQFREAVSAALEALRSDEEEQ